MMPVEPQAEHRWLQKLVGDWTYEAEAQMAPDKPVESCGSGTESVRMLGGLWLLAEGKGQMPGGAPAATLMTLGFDPGKKRFHGTWIGSMMTHLWVYDGELDATGRILSLHAEGPSFAGDGTMAKYKDVIEIVSEDHRTLSGNLLGDDGKWVTFMTAHYRRVR
jgi:Protein of unknown function (DUF1579)